MDITLRGTTHQAEHLTDINYLALGNLFIDDKGNFEIEGVDDYDNLPETAKRRLTRSMMRKLADPKEREAIACSLCAIFPSLPKELVDYKGDGTFTLNIWMKELLEISIAVANSFSENSSPKAKKSLSPDEVVDLKKQLEDIQGRLAKVE